MKQTNMIRLLLSRAALTLALSVALPAVASAVPISLSGSVDQVTVFDGTSPFEVGDPLSGLFNVDVDPDNTFDAGDLLDFTLTVGPATFNLTGDDFVNFNGQLSNDGSTLTFFSVISTPVPASGVSGSFLLTFNNPTLPFVVIGTTNDPSDAITITGDFSANVRTAAVPEPPMLALFAFITLALGFAARRRRRGGERPRAEFS